MYIYIYVFVYIHTYRSPYSPAATASTNNSAGLRTPPADRAGQVLEKGGEGVELGVDLVKLEVMQVRAEGREGEKRRRRGRGGWGVKVSLWRYCCLCLHRIRQAHGARIYEERKRGKNRYMKGCRGVHCFVNNVVD